MEMPGIDPGTSRMLSERSTIWATPPWRIIPYSQIHSVPWFRVLMLYIRCEDIQGSWFETVKKCENSWFLKFMEISLILSVKPLIIIFNKVVNLHENISAAHYELSKNLRIDFLSNFQPFELYRLSNSDLPHLLYVTYTMSRLNSEDFLRSWKLRNII